jgi:trehalose-phosphatase
MKSFWVDWPKLKRRVFARKKKLLLLDFDGTLAPIAQHPDNVILNKRTEKALRMLTRSHTFQITVISGRSLKDLRSYFSLKNIVCIGNHGFEFKGGGLSTPLVVRRIKKILRSMSLMVKKLEKSFRDIPGVWLENKSYTLSLHFRELSKTHHSLFQKKLDNLRKEHHHFPLAWKRGKKVWEIRPRLLWGKGEAALYLLRKFPGLLPIVVGDDKTDEDMFEALEDQGITVRVGFSRNSKAKYYLKSSREVTRLLEELCP